MHCVCAVGVYMYMCMHMHMCMHMCIVWLFVSVPKCVRCGSCAEMHVALRIINWVCEGDSRRGTGAISGLSRMGLRPHAGAGLKRQRAKRTSRRGGIGVC